MVIMDEHLSSEGRTLSLCVRDDGPGIPQEECSKVSEPFYQVGNTGNNGSGVGIGSVSYTHLFVPCSFNGQRSCLPIWLASPA